ncbi:hypothetical protein GGS23DRAFT_518189 [Durotheca rogersii]|uniref:uncharacterized protein n=1 Tax=Durotheca rogersii TaxID=419775 RepID=UPI00221E6432|nr:uncharacterized protein GGS23DRAFT_518189 [Durotheca rogersii]KAI5863878.1 hypothetical protein GGS23DRAFT_518189 [Durotheca rogersii]
MDIQLCFSHRLLLLFSARESTPPTSICSRQGASTKLLPLPRPSRGWFELTELTSYLLRRETRGPNGPTNALDTYYAVGAYQASLAILNVLLAISDNAAASTQPQLAKPWLAWPFGFAHRPMKNYWILPLLYLGLRPSRQTIMPSRQAVKDDGLSSWRKRATTIGEWDLIESDCFILFTCFAYIFQSRVGGCAKISERRCPSVAAWLPLTPV